MRIKKGIFMGRVKIVLFTAICFWISPLQAELEYGKTYDQSNYQEIEDMLLPSILTWMKNGEFIIKTGKLEFEFKQADAYILASKQNEGKYDIDPEGFLIDKQTGEIPQFYYGDPFPAIDPKDPKAGPKIMENHCASRYHTAGHYSAGQVHWLGAKGKERDILTGGDYLHFMNRRGGPVPNPNNFLDLAINYVVEPYDIRGVVTMSWIYNDLREDTCFNYLPMIRRVMRTSAAARSDPFMGSDLCMDDADTYAGKGAFFEWQYIGEKQVLLSFMGTKKTPTRRFPDGSIEMVYPDVQGGWETPGWQGLSWCPMSAIWTPRDCWIVEGNPKDLYYNYGRQVFYVDKLKGHSVVKLVYNRAGEYWKTVLSIAPFCETPDGDNTVGYSSVYFMADDRTRHASWADVVDPLKDLPNNINMPIDKLGPDRFTAATMIQLSK